MGIRFGHRAVDEEPLGGALARRPAATTVTAIVPDRREAACARLSRLEGRPLGVGIWTVLEWWRAGPFRRDDRVELSPHEVLIATQQLNELFARSKCVAGWRAVP
jgi:hypothetical protein